MRGIITMIAVLMFSIANAQDVTLTGSIVKYNNEKVEIPIVVHFYPDQALFTVNNSGVRMVKIRGLSVNPSGKMRYALVNEKGEASSMIIVDDFAIWTIGSNKFYIKAIINRKI